MEEPTDPGRFVTLARLVRTHGRSGELAAELEADTPDVLAVSREVELWDGAGRRQRHVLQSTRPHGDRLIVRFEGIDTMDQAEGLVGCDVRVPADRLPAPPPGRFYWRDLTGCRVVDRRSGHDLGEVRGVLETGGTPLLQVGACEEEEILVPFAASICVNVDPNARLIQVDLPAGLENLNRNGKDRRVLTTPEEERPCDSTL